MLLDKNAPQKLSPQETSVSEELNFACDSNLLRRRRVNKRVLKKLEVKVCDNILTQTLNAPIIPFVGFGNIKLYATRQELKELLSLDGVESVVINSNWIRYDIQNAIELFFHLGNDKLFRITTLDNYKGSLFGQIKVGSTKDEMLEIEPSFVYNDFEEVWESEKGAFIEMDAKTDTVRWISVFIPELDSEEFENCKW